MTVFQVTVSFGHAVVLKFYATKEYLKKFNKKLKLNKKFDLIFSRDVSVIVNPDFVQLTKAVKVEEDTLPIEELQKTGLSFIELHT
ncbi:hypothetical protein P8918_12580 [Bacillus spizizenii]|nr:hypothetical protein [Bacillus spizizenii]MCY8890406.1 hypothetical protein [Bacillus spizizenii]MEC0841861.1 hypothetical protein [Bacillus spizizenii]